MIFSGYSMSFIVVVDECYVVTGVDPDDVWSIFEILDVHGGDGS